MTRPLPDWAIEPEAAFAIIAGLPLDPVFLTPEHVALLPESLRAILEGERRAA